MRKRDAAEGAAARPRLGRWQAVYAAPSLGGGQGEWLQPMSGALLLADSDQFSALWRSTNGSSWRAVKLPHVLAGGGLTGATADGGRRVVLAGDSISLAPGDGRADLVWSASSELRLAPAKLPSGYGLAYFEPASSGFAAIGELDRGGSAGALLRSASGLRWHIAGRLHFPRNLLAAASQGLVLAGRAMVLLATLGPTQPTARAQIWYSGNGRSWRRAKVYGGLPLAGGLRYAPASFPQIFAADGGLILYDSSNTALWWSAHGRVWRRVHVRAAPPANLAPQGLQGLAVDGHTLIVTEHATRAGHGLPAGATTFWQLELSGH